MFEGHNWHNPPPHWSVDETGLSVTAAAETDFWKNTFYGFKHSNGHLFAKMVEGDFSAEAVFSSAYPEQYDQAGIMLRVNDENWIKTGIEFTDGKPHMSAVITRDDQSDWSVIPLPAEAMVGMHVRLTRHDEAVRVQYRWGDMPWEMARLGFLAMPSRVAVGPMVCSPLGADLVVHFSRFEIGPAISRELHAV